MKFLLQLSLLLCFTLAFSQDNSDSQNIEKTESIKPLRLGVRVGAPNLITANIEYVTPLLNNRVAATLDYMSLSKTVDDISIKYNNFEIGTNVYLQKNGKGLYAAFSYFSFKGDGDFVSVDFDDNTSGDGKANISFNTLNLKLGAKLGRVFYFRIEAGYGFGAIPETVLVKSNNSNATATEDIPKIPGMSTSGTFVANIGFGFGFL